MAGIADAMRDILTQLRSQQVMNNDHNLVTPYVRIWNNQLSYDKDGKMENFPKPAFFLEPLNDIEWEELGQGYRSADIGFAIHVVHEFYNADDGTFEQDLEVFVIRDAITALLTYFRPAGCGAMACIKETQDFEHDNLYHLILVFACNFTDSKGSRRDPARNYYKQSVPPTGLQVNASRKIAVNGVLGTERAQGEGPITTEDGKEILL